MKYLFFDIECANNANGTAKICEFGYVLVDSSFNILEKDNFLINPNDKFDWYVIKKLLAYDKETYFNSPDYPHFYDKISSLFNDTDTIVLGHTIAGDAKYLNDEAKRYNLPFFNYDFYDVRIIYKEYAGDKESKSVEKIGEELGSALPVHAHTAVDDACATMLIAKKLCEKENLELIDLLKRFKNSKGFSKDGLVNTIEMEENARHRHETGADNKMFGDNYKKFMEHLPELKPQGKIVKSPLNGKTITINPLYQSRHLREMYKLVQLLKNHDCTYLSRTIKVDYYVDKKIYAKDGSIKTCEMTKAIKRAIKKGTSNSIIITFDELLEILGTTEEEISKD